MAKQKATTGIPRFTVNKATKSKICLGKLSIPTVSIDKLTDAIQEALENATAAGIEPKSVRGVLSLY